MRYFSHMKVLFKLHNSLKLHQNKDLEFKIIQFRIKSNIKSFLLLTHLSVMDKFND